MKSGKCWVSSFVAGIAIVFTCFYYTSIWYMYIHQLHYTSLHVRTYYMNVHIISYTSYHYHVLKSMKHPQKHVWRLHWTTPTWKHWLTVGVRFPIGEGWPCHARSLHNHGFCGKLPLRKLVSWRYPKFILNHDWGRKSNEGISKKLLDKHGP